MRWLPVWELIGASWVLNFPALASLKRFDEALDCVDKLLNIDQRDQVIDDHEPWHPTRPIVASVSSLGLIKYLGHWSAYAPGFDKIDENVEYSEGEDKLDYHTYLLYSGPLFDGGERNRKMNQTLKGEEKMNKKGQSRYLKQAKL
ncbi:hypothetical protein MJO28_003104 [Puccinia striiformis f. sp. tritici]|uniref:Uncharacterized protein n=1 Tax=Puccinia striiformis f. sp. tritici TaxID=168172 RepID=A0ACC0ETB2_9BASI|nr:hypothetical protein MJO28_003104 [Puccinia striiformis f. sp. tritici]